MTIPDNPCIEEARELAREINAKWSKVASEIEEFAERDAPAIATALTKRYNEGLEAGFEAVRSLPHVAAVDRYTVEECLHVIGALRQGGESGQ